MIGSCFQQLHTFDGIAFLKGDCTRFVGMVVFFLPSGALLVWQWTVVGGAWKLLLVCSALCAVVHFFALYRAMFGDRRHYELLDGSLATNELEMTEADTLEMTEANELEMTEANELEANAADELEANAANKLGMTGAVPLGAQLANRGMEVAAACKHCDEVHGRERKWCNECKECQLWCDHHCGLIGICVHAGTRPMYGLLLASAAMGVALLLLPMRFAPENVAVLNGEHALLGWECISPVMMRAFVLMLHCACFTPLVFILQQLEYLIFVFGTGWCGLGKRFYYGNPTCPIMYTDGLYLPLLNELDAIQKFGLHILSVVTSLWMLTLTTDGTFNVGSAIYHILHAPKCSVGLV